MEATATSRHSYGRSDTLAVAAGLLGTATFLGSFSVVAGLWRGPVWLLFFAFLGGTSGAVSGLASMMVKPSRGIGWRWLGFLGLTMSGLGILYTWIIWVAVTSF